MKRPVESAPASWFRKPLKYAAVLNPDTLPEDTDPSFSFRYIDISNVDSQGRIGEGESQSFAQAPSRARRRARPGDCVISTVRTYLKAIGKVGADSDQLVFSTGFAVLRPRSEMSSDFFFYALQGESFIENVIARSEGIGYPAIAPADLGRVPIAFPDLAHQRTIVAFLDAEMVRIDELVAKNDRLIELLEEKRAALITQVVTRGLDPNVPMKESGVEWLPRVPATWSVERNKVLFREWDDRSVAGEEELLTVSHLTGVTRRSEKNVNMIEAESHEGYKRCQPGDLVINTMWAWMGALGVAGEAGMVSPSYNVYRPGPRLCPGYVDHLCRIPAYVSELTRRSKGVWKSRLRLYPEDFMEVKTAVPPTSEQALIANFVSRELELLNGLTAKLRNAIQKLREYRSALISAAVTGRINVRAAL